MFIGVSNRSQLQGGGVLGNAVLKELESLIAGVSAWGSVEHNDNGTHAAITATKATITAATTAYALQVISGLSEFGAAVNLPGTLTAPQITANTNDYAPLGYDTVFGLRVSTDASRNVTGIVAPAYASGRMLFLVNVGSNNLVVQHENAGSVAANRFSIPGASDVTMTPLSTLLLWYDPTSERWRSLGGSASSGSVTPHNLLSVTHPDTTTASPVQGDVIVADGASAGAVDSLKYWADGESFGGISDALDPGILSYWYDGISGQELPPSLAVGTPTWQRKATGTIGQVLTVTLVDGRLVPGWASQATGVTGTGVKAYTSANVAFLTGVRFLVPWTAVEFDTGAYWSGSDPSKLIAGSTGLYTMTAQLWYPDGSGAAYVGIFVNGTLKAETQGGLDNLGGAYDQEPKQCSCQLYLTAGDYVQVYGLSRSTFAATLAVTGGQNKSWVSMVKVG